MMFDQVKQPAYLPSPEEIERKCEEIRRKWSDHERQRRMLFVLTKWDATPQFEDEA
jgi:hypothetical protein